jgi:hypothetical protein
MRKGESNLSPDGTPVAELPPLSPADFESVQGLVEIVAV